VLVQVQITVYIKLNSAMEGTSMVIYVFHLSLIYENKALQG
jgi:hypothetical protein